MHRLLVILLLMTPVYAELPSVFCESANKMLEESAEQSRRLVTCVQRDEKGNILALGGPWGVVRRDVAIEQISTQSYYYYVQSNEGRHLLLIVDNDLNLGPVIRVCSPQSHDNALDQLPICPTSSY